MTDITEPPAPTSIDTILREMLSIMSEIVARVIALEAK